MSEELDKLLYEVQAEKEAKTRQQEELRAELEASMPSKEEIEARRKEKVAGFCLQLDLPDDEPLPQEEPVAQSEDSEAPVQSDEAATAEVLPEADPSAEDVLVEESPAEEDTVAEKTEDAFSGFFTEEDTEPDRKKEKKPAKKRKKRKSSAAAAILKAFVYVTAVLGISGVLAYFCIAGVIDLLGMNKSSEPVSVTILAGSGTADIAEELYNKGLIDQPFIFRLYSRLTGADGQYKPHKNIQLSPNMGYGGLIDALTSSPKREEITVTIPEGFTVKKIAALLEEKMVCTADDFLAALEKVDYSDYDFLADLPTEEDDPKYANRVYALEGYLFPDTYNFFTNSDAETAVAKLLDGFGNRLSTDIRTTLKANKMSINDAIILASIVQAEVSDTVDMQKVARVLFNRLNNPAEFPEMECDTTQEYITRLMGTDDMTEIRKAYDTYVCKGLPVGAICNPGLDAIQAVVKPSANKDVVKCYFFATDLKTGITYFSRTHSEHEAICKKYGIGMYG